MPDFAVTPEKNAKLKKKMEELGVTEEDFLEKFIRASGRGGQKINKTSSSVYLKHLPTGLDVKCMKERSQSVNRFLARRELLEKIEAHQTGKNVKDKKTEKLRKQKAKRRKRSVKKYDDKGEAKDGQ